MARRNKDIGAVDEVSLNETSTDKTDGVDIHVGGGEANETTTLRDRLMESEK